MRLDVHKFTLNEALDEIMIKFYECVELQDFSLEIIHGYKHGTRIKDYIRSSGFIKEAARFRYEFVSKNFADKGVTIFLLKSSKNISKINPIQRSPSTGTISENKMPLNFCLKCKIALIFIKEVNWYECPNCGKLTRR
ncbi:hypothetical protein LCGC14_1748710 [marine sediment metagenome]|uniref:Smr domain-containing protein n=1 Tax=marine sediment metagenome TaxID=412755 RepID=A0A0F9HRW8_9ZZZZ